LCLSHHAISYPPENSPQKKFSSVFSPAQDWPLLFSQTSAVDAVIFLHILNFFPTTHLQVHPTDIGTEITFLLRVRRFAMARNPKFQKRNAEGSSS
jgi:hypothetical protein